MNTKENCCKEAAALFRLHTNVPSERIGCCRTPNPELSSPQTIHCTTENFWVLKRMYLNAFKYNVSKMCTQIWKSDMLYIPKSEKC
jgi:hypothetical protein